MDTRLDIFKMRQEMEWAALREKWSPYIEVVNGHMVEAGFDPMTDAEAGEMAEDLECVLKYSKPEHMGQMLPAHAAYHGTKSMKIQEESWR